MGYKIPEIKILVVWDSVEKVFCQVNFWNKLYGDKHCKVKYF